MKERSNAMSTRVPESTSSSQSSAGGKKKESSKAEYNVEKNDSGCTSAGLKTWENPTPRQSSAISSVDLDLLQDAFVTACRRMRRPRKLPSREELIRRGEEHDRLSLQIALRTYAKKNNMLPSELDFLEVKKRNLIVEGGKGYVHFNFLVKDILDDTSSLFFAEIHPDCKKEDDVYLCCPLEDNDCGNCFGCQRQALDLRHPTSGYLGGHQDVCFPFMVLENEEEEE
uniref:DUF3615 domain-containing protein n=2 Tax=Leersia perrieri TaxID=77586 RepID=A0A0D9XM68_9ORYZ